MSASLPSLVGWGGPGVRTQHANQLWDNDPPEVWLAARRLRDQGIERHDILHELIDVMVTHMHPVMADKKMFDTDAHQFEARGRLYADTRFGGSGGALDERRSTLADVAPRVRGRLFYTYDFGDDWAHGIVVEAVDPAEPEARVVCLDGERAGPPEDSGGVFAYVNVLDALGDRGHPDRDELLDWVDEDFDPAAVDPDAINAALAAVSVPGGR